MLRSISSNWSLNVLQILVFMVLTPFAANALSTEVYGIWEVIVSAAGPLQLLALGLPMATVRAVSRNSDDPDAASRAVGTSVSMTLILGTIAAAASVLAYGFFETTMLGNPKWASVPADRVDDARAGLVIMLAHVSAGFTLALPYAVYEAHRDFVAKNLIMGSGMLLKLLFTIVFLSMRADLVVLAGIQLAVAAIEFVTAYTISKRRHPGVRFAPRKIEFAEARSLLSFSVFAFMLNMGALLAFRIDALVIGAHADNAAAAIYGYGNKIFDPFINLLLAIGMVLMPMAATESKRGNLPAVRDAFLRWSKVAATLVFMIGGYLIVVGPAFLEWWLGGVYVPESGRLLRILMVSFFLFLPVRGVVLPTLMGVGKAKWPGLGLLGMGIANLLLSLALIGPYGLRGVALGTAIPNVVFSLTFAVAACRVLDVRIVDWVGYAFARTVVATLAAGGALYGVDRIAPIEGFFPLVAGGLGYCALFGVLVVYFVYRDDRYVDLRGRVPGLSARAGS